MNWKEFGENATMPVIAWSVRLQGVTPLLGGMPKTQNLIEGQMASKEVRLRAKEKGRAVESIVAENMEAMGLDAGDVVEADEERASCGFRTNADGLLCVGGHQIPAMLIDAATSLKLTRTVRGLKDILDRNMRVYCDGNLLPVLNGTGKPITEPTGTEEWGAQIKDRMGSRAILRRYDYVEPWALTFTIDYPDTSVITKAVWAQLWQAAERQGFGAARPKGYGRFTVEAMERA